MPATGAFSLTLPKRAGTLHITAPRYLATNSVVDGNTNDPNFHSTLLAGNIDGNNTIDLTDLIDLLNVYGAISGDAAYASQPYADLNLDNTVDLTDLIMLLNNYGDSGGNRRKGKPGRG